MIVRLFIKINNTMANLNFRDIYLKLMSKQQVKYEELLYFTKHTYEILFPDKHYDEKAAITAIQSPFRDHFIYGFLQTVDKNAAAFNMNLIKILDHNNIIKIIINENSSN